MPKCETGNSFRINNGSRVLKAENVEAGSADFLNFIIEIFRTVDFLHTRIFLLTAV